MKYFHYFVSYQYNDNDGDSGFGQVNMLLKQPISNSDVVDDVRKYIEDKYNYQGVVLMNFQLLQEEVVAAE